MMTELEKRLFQMQDKDYAAFQARLTPGIPPESITRNRALLPGLITKPSRRLARVTVLPRNRKAVSEL